MIGLASGLLAIAGLFAGRAIAIARMPMGWRRGWGSSGTGRRLGRLPGYLVWPPILLIAAVATGPVVAIGGLAGAASIRHLVRRRRRTRERHRAAEQIADAVGALSAGLRAGLSLPQSFAYARDEANEPLRSDLAGMVDKIDVGTPVGEALSDWADAQGSEDALLIVGCLGSSSSQWRRSADRPRRSRGDVAGAPCGVSATCAPSRPKPVCRA